MRTRNRTSSWVMPEDFEELLVVRFLRERLLLGQLELLLDVGVLDLDALVLGLARDPLRSDQELHDLIA